MDDVHPHGGFGALGVAGFDEMDDLPVVLKGVSDAFFHVDDIVINGFIHNRKELVHKLVVAGGGDGVMEVLLQTKPLLDAAAARGDGLLDLITQLPDLLLFFSGGPFGGVVGGGRLSHHTDLQHIPVADSQVFQGGEVCCCGFIGGDKGAAAPLDLHQSPGTEDADGLPQRHAADAQLLGQFHLVWQLVAGLEPFFHQDHIHDAACCLFGKGGNGHKSPSFKVNSFPKTSYDR